MCVCVWGKLRRRIPGRGAVRPRAARSCPGELSSLQAPRSPRKRRLRSSDGARPLCASLAAVGIRPPSPPRSPGEGPSRPPRVRTQRNSGLLGACAARAPRTGLSRPVRRASGPVTSAGRSQSAAGGGEERRGRARRPPPGLLSPPRSPRHPRRPGSAFGSLSGRAELWGASALFRRGRSSLGLSLGAPELSAPLLGAHRGGYRRRRPSEDPRWTARVSPGSVSCRGTPIGQPRLPPRRPRRPRPSRSSGGRSCREEPQRASRSRRAQPPRGEAGTGWATPPGGWCVAMKLPSLPVPRSADSLVVASPRRTEGFPGRKPREAAAFLRS